MTGARALGRLIPDVVVAPYPNQTPPASKRTMDRTLAARLIDLYNDQFATVFAAAKARGNEEELRRGLGSFLSRTTEFAKIFRDVVITTDGRFDRESMLRTLEAIQYPNAFVLLRQGLAEILDFILFCAMQAIEYMDEQAFSQQVQEILAEAEREEGKAGGAQPSSSAPIIVLDLEDPVLMLEPGANPSCLFEGPAFDALLEPRSAHPDDVAPMPPSGRIAVAIMPSLPDEQAYEFSAAIRAARSEATFALERAEQIASLARSDELREVALRCQEHAASAIRALGQLEQLVARLRRR